MIHLIQLAYHHHAALTWLVIGRNVVWFVPHAVTSGALEGGICGAVGCLLH